MKKYRFGHPVETEAVLISVPEETGQPEPFQAEEKEDGIWLNVKLDPDDIVYGLGESIRGINKRGWEYIQEAEDDPDQYEDRRSLYTAHNFILIDGKNHAPYGLFLDQPGRSRFDIGYTKQDELVIEAGSDFDLYILTGADPEEIIREFREAIGRSYIPPKFAFGNAQSRWGYKTKDDFRKVVDAYDAAGIPLDLVNMDIDYLDQYKDFTLNPDYYQNDFPQFVQEMKDRDIHLVPIIDAAVKKQEGYPVYEEGKEKDYFCKLEDRISDFEGAAWPGYAMFPDFLNDEAREWFGNQYRFLTDMGIDAFWNDMNEPAIFYSRQGIEDLKSYLKEFIADERNEVPIFPLTGKVAGVKNSREDFRRFWHNRNGQWIRHDKIHNLYGYYMTRSASEAFERLRPGLRTLMYSRSSYIGMHRYGGIWTGDNKSWWSHILLMLHQLPALNMAGFLYTGCDLGGFGADTTRDLLLRYYQLGIFTPLMRNHSSAGTRLQEPYQFEQPEDFAHVIGVRYRLLPYLYSEFMKAALTSSLLFRPLAFTYPEDARAREVEDQLLLGNEIMIAPVYSQNKTGRMVYLPEEMIKVTFRKDGTIAEEVLSAGDHYISYPLDEVVFFVRKGKTIPVAEKAMRVPEIDTSTMQMIGFPGSQYTFYEDDGISSRLNASWRVLTKE